MLNRAKVARELAGAADRLFIDYTPEHEAALAQFKACAADSSALEKVLANPGLELVTWQGSLLDHYPITPFQDPYQVVAVDGSQLYPDKHQGTGCYLINIGSVVFRYELPRGASQFSSEPFLFLPDASSEIIDYERCAGVDLVDGKREELEFLHGFVASDEALKQFPELPLLCMFDGSLIFWHLESKDAKLRDHFLHRYCMILERYYQEKIPVIGYMSLSKHRDLVRLIRAYATYFSPAMFKKSSLFYHTFDESLMQTILPEGHFSTLFQPHSELIFLYPSHLRPWFCYYMTPDELVRLEFPEYLALNKPVLNQAIAMVVDQIVKGNGYPISVAEAHGQAVVKGPDRLFFYHALEKYSIEQKRRMLMSQKSRKKRRMSI